MSESETLLHQLSENDNIEIEMSGSGTSSIPNPRAPVSPPPTKKKRMNMDKATTCLEAKLVNRTITFIIIC